MNLRLIKYNNRKLYISGSINDMDQVKALGWKAGYINLTEIRDILLKNPKVKVIVYKSDDYTDITKQTLLQALMPSWFTSKDLHDLIRQQFLVPPVLDTRLSETRVCTNGIEL